MRANAPRIVVFSSLFPNSKQPHAGLFVRERMFRVAREVPLVVVSPKPWFPLQGLIRWWRPNYRPAAPRFETQQGIEVHFPRFLALPGVLRGMDGVSMALFSVPTLIKIRRRHRFNLIDAHFAYPDGYAATLLGKWFGAPATITLRGTESGQAARPALRAKLAAALNRAKHVFAVADALKRVAVDVGTPPEKITVVGNGVDLEKFRPIPQHAARQELALPLDASVLISVGGLVERKGFHRVIECLPALLEQVPNLYYLVVGGASPEGDMSAELRDLAARLGVADRVIFTGPLPAQRLHVPLSAADVFVLATRNEGWANVFLEAMACGLPVVTTDVGGNKEVVCREELGTIVRFGDAHALVNAIARALATNWDRDAIVGYAQENTWERRVSVLVASFRRLVGEYAPARQQE
jgi:teichuronic acid biosynthesis glycosyltransferase TuaC